VAPARQEPPLPSSTRTLPGAPAEVGNRFVARLVDALVVGLVVVPLVLTGVLPDSGLGALAVGSLGFLYGAALDATGGTLGKRLLRMQVVDRHGRPPGLGAGATRNLWLLTSLLPGLAGQTVAVTVSVLIAISIARDPIDLGWHDRLAGTAVRRPA
jgi:uncharacterized RDD family membrane protein YckC